jgi:hypothetical protein
MQTRRRKLIRTAVIGVATFAALASVGARAPHANSPCPPFFPATLTGTLIETRAGDTLIAYDEAIQAGALPRVCVAPTFGGSSTQLVTISDCETNPGWPVYMLTVSP